MLINLAVSTCQGHFSPWNDDALLVTKASKQTIYGCRVVEAAGKTACSYSTVQLIFVILRF